MRACADEKRGLIVLQRPQRRSWETTGDGRVAMRTFWERFVEVEVAVLPVISEVLHEELGPALVAGSLRLKDIGFPSEESVWIVVAFETTGERHSHMGALKRAAESAEALLGPEVRDLFERPTTVIKVVFS